MPCLLYIPGQQQRVLLICIFINSGILNEGNVEMLQSHFQLFIVYHWWKNHIKQIIIQYIIFFKL
uniref:Uncharacterized protein n=1 Tax=Anguilla anguilla TaxID=7936 RepID=A0A0E9TAD9_ANGAN